MRAEDVEYGAEHIPAGTPHVADDVMMNVYHAPGWRLSIVVAATSTPYYASACRALKDRQAEASQVPCASERKAGR